MPTCCYLKCNSSDRNFKVKQVTFHGIPKEPRLRQKWVKIIQRQRRENDWIAKDSTKVCSLHFKESDLYSTTTGMRKLKLSAIPVFEVHKQPRASTSTAAAAKKKTRRTSRGNSSTSPILDSDDEPAEQDAEDSEEDVHYTSSKESQNGRMRLSDGTGSAGSLLPETPAQSLQQELLMDLHEMSDKIQNLYPTALGKQFTLTFKGEDGDKSEYVFTSASETRRSGERHSGLSCNECGSEIIGFRYKCVSCADYDLCSACEALGTHADHLMMRIAKPLKLKQARTLLQRWCEAMKTAGVTTTEEITGAPNTAVPTVPDTAAPDTTAPTAGPSVTVDPVNVKSKVIKAKTPKGKGKSSKKGRAQSPAKSIEAKKRKKDIAEDGNRAKKKYADSSAGDKPTEMPVPIKEEPENKDLANYYSSFTETEPTVEIEDIKDEDPDPLDTDNIVTGVIEEDASSTLPGPSKSTATSVQMYTHKPAK